jgi:hypothetical protein
MRAVPGSCERHALPLFPGLRVQSTVPLSANSLPISLPVGMEERSPVRDARLEPRNSGRIGSEDRVLIDSVPLLSMESALRFMDRRAYSEATNGARELFN